jgi:hypothetical protein
MPSRLQTLISSTKIQVGYLSNSLVSRSQVQPGNAILEALPRLSELISAKPNQLTAKFNDGQEPSVRAKLASPTAPMPNPSLTQKASQRND